jgi:hypothetical protein
MNRYIKLYNYTANVRKDIPDNQGNASLRSEAQFLSQDMSNADDRDNEPNESNEVQRPNGWADDTSSSEGMNF